MLNLSNPSVFQPLIGTRISEILAWVLTLVLIVTSWISSMKSSFGQTVTIVLVGFFGLSAVLISFGNWVERQTSLELNEFSSTFKNGLRKVEIKWEEIFEVRVYPSSFGNKVVVYGDQKYFSFQTLGEVVMDDQIKARFGFERGEEILDIIIRHSELSDSFMQTDDSYYYYLRE
jgi:hypothetical protein